MEGLGIFKLVFGNIVGAINWKNNQLKDDAMQDFSVLFYNSFRESLKKLKYTIGKDDKVTFNSLERLLSLEQREIRSLFEIEIYNLDSFKNAIKDTYLILQLQKRLLSIVKEYGGFLDERVAIKIIEEALKHFYKEVRYRISEKQSLYLVLEQVFENAEKFDEFQIQLTELKNDVSFIKNGIQNISSKFELSNDKLDDIHKTVGINDELKEENEQAEKLINNHNQIHIKEINDLISHYNYEIAIEKLNKLRDLLENNEVKDENLGFIVFNKLGLCNERIENASNANDFYIKALNFKPNSPSIIRQAIIAYEREGKQSEKDRLVKKLFRDFPNDKNTLIVKLEGIETEENLKDFIQKNENIIDSDDIDILLTLYRTYNIFENSAKAIEKLEKAIPLAEEELLPFLESMIAYNISHKYLEAFDLLEKSNLSISDKEEIQKGINYYEKAWNTFKNTSQKKLQSRILINLAGLYTLLEDVENSIKITKEAIDIAPSAFYLQKLLVFLHLNNNLDAIIKEVRKWEWEAIKNEHDIVSIYIIALSTSKNDKNIEELIQIGIDFISEQRDSFQFDTILSVLTFNLIRLKEFEQVEKLLIKLKIEFPEKDKLELIESRLLRNKGEIENAKAVLKSINERYIKSISVDRLLLFELIEENLRNGETDLVIQLFEKHINVEETYHSHSVSIYLEACFNLERQDKALNLFEKMRKVYGIHPKHSKNEIAIHFENKNYQQALKLATSYLNKYSDDLTFKIFYCELLIITDNKDLAKKQEFDIDYEKLPIQSFKGLIKTYILLNEKEKLYNLLYEVWRVQRNAEVCEAITLAMTQIPITSDELKVETINENCVAYLDNEFGKEEYYIFTSREHTLPRLREYNLERDFKELRGKKIGDTISYGKNPMNGKQFKKTIQKILTIHQFIFLDSRDALASEYQGQTSITAFNFKSAEEGAKYIFDSLHNESRINNYKENVKRDNQDLDKYITGNLPFGIIATALQVSPIALWYSFTEDNKIGIFNNYPLNIDSSQETLNNIISGICCDITTLLTIFKLDLGELFIEKFGEIVIAQSTLDLIKNNNISEFRIGMSNIQIPYQDNFNKVRHSFINQEKEAFLKDLSEFLSWVKQYCTVEITSERLKIPNQKQKVYADVLNDSTYDTLLIAKEKGYVFFSEDYWTRLASTAFELQYLWIARTLSYLREKSEKSSEAKLITKALVELHKLNYKTLKVDAYQLMEVVNDKPLFIKLTHLMNNNLLAEEYRMKQFLLFLKLLWQSNIENKQDITFIFLTHFVAVNPTATQANEFRKYILRNLEKEFDRTQFGLLSSVISNWATNVPNIKSKIQQEVSIDKFKSLDIRVGTIINVKELPNKFSKSFILTLDLGFEEREVVCSIKEFYKTEELINTKVSVIVNLPKRIVGGVSSHGIVLTSMNDGGRVCLIRPEGGDNGFVIQ
jgi:methionine--tRNA ligase beta chain